MKRTMLLNAEISMLIASMGHGDMVVVGDAGLPIPTGLGGPQRIDLAVCPGVPSLDQVLTAVLSELQVEHAYIATEALQGEKKHCRHGAGLAPSWILKPSVTSSSKRYATRHVPSYVQVSAHPMPIWCWSLA
jgi:hypothetical protein